MIKRFFNIAIMLLPFLGLISCDDGKAQLAHELQGSWSGAPQRMVDGPADETSVIETIDFFEGDSVAGGNLIVNSMISMTGAVSGSDAINQPFSLTASASATVSGDWVATSNDKVTVNLDLTTLDVQVDPKDVVLSTDIVTGDESPAIDSITPGLALQIKKQIANNLQVKYMAMRYLENVKVNDNTLTYNMGGVEYSLKHQDFSE